MKDQETTFDLSHFLPHSLFIDENIVPDARLACKKKPAPNLLELLVKEDPLEILGETVSTWNSTAEVVPFVVPSPLQQFYTGSNILITGGTGFLGKVLVQKIVRSFPNIGNIYLLIRKKRGTTPQDRLQCLMEDKLFLRMRTEVPQYLSKLTVVEGDISEPGLGLSAEDRQMLVDNVNIIFHSAANVKFNEPLKPCLQSNLVGSQRMLDLAKNMQNLKAYVHVSTAYSHCVRRVIEEKCYTVSINYSDVLRYTENNTEQEVDSETTRLLQGWPNTYTFSKALTEDMIQREAKNLPICIFRPTVVMPTYEDPVRAWTDNVNGATGVLLGVALGIIHVYRGDVELALDLVPVDFVVNSIIAVAADQVRRTSEEIPVYNFSCTPNNYMIWKRLYTIFKKYGHVFPFEKAVWHCTMFITKSNLVDNIGHIFLHKIPGKALDLLATAGGEKPRLSKIYDKLDFLKRKLSFFMLGVWEFRNENISLLWNKLDETDKGMFPFDVSDIDFDSYMLTVALGVRYYFLKEKMETLQKSARKIRWLKWAHYALVAVTSLTALKLAAILAHALPI